MQITVLHRLILLNIFLSFITNCSIYYGDYCYRKESSFIFASCIQCLEGYKLVDGRCYKCKVGEQSTECSNKKNLYYGTNRGVSLESVTDKEESVEDRQIIAGSEIFDELLEKIKSQTDNEQVISKFIVLCKKFAETSNYNESCVDFDEFGCTECQDGYNLTGFSNIDVKTENQEGKNQPELNYFRKICIQNSEHQEHSQDIIDEPSTKDPRKHCLIYSEKQDKCLLCIEDKNLRLNQNGICSFGQSSLKESEKETDQQIIEESYKLKGEQEPLAEELMGNQKKKPQKQILSIEKVTLKPKKEGEELTYKLPIKGEKKPLTIFVIQQKYRNQPQRQQFEEIQSSQGQSPSQNIKDEDAYILILIDSNQTQESAGQEEIPSSSSNQSQIDQNSNISTNQLRQQAEQNQSAKELLNSPQEANKSVHQPQQAKQQMNKPLQTQQSANSQQAQQSAELSQQVKKSQSIDLPVKQSVNQQSQPKQSVNSTQQIKKSEESPQQIKKLQSMGFSSQTKQLKDSPQQVEEVEFDTSKYDVIQLQNQQSVDKIRDYQQLRDNYEYNFGAKSKYQSYGFKDKSRNSGLFESSYSSFNLFDDQDSNCLLFSGEDPSSCEKCKFLYFLSQVSGKCIKADPFCLKFNAVEGKCSQCKQGFELSNERCIRNLF